MAKSVEYWKRRAEHRMFEEMAKAEGAADIISKVYASAAAYLIQKAEHVFDRFYTSEKMTEAEALTLIRSMSNPDDVDEMVRRLEADDSKAAKEALKRLRSAGAYGSRLKRIKELLNQTNRIMTSVYGQEKNEVTGVLKSIATDSYNKTMYDLQQRIETGFSVAHIDQKQIEKVLNMNWSGAHFSKRIWGNTQRLGQAVKEQILEGTLTGKTEREMAEVINGEFAKGSRTARRLVRTESCYVSSEMNAEAYEDAGVEMYLFLATLDMKTSKVCRSLDGKRFPLEDRTPGVNCPPMHPWCRSTTIAIVDEEYLKTMKRTARNPVTGKNEKVPLSMTYEEWYKKYVEGEEDQEEENAQETPEIQEEAAVEDHNAEQPEKEHQVVNGEQIIDSFKRRPEYAYGIEDAINAQGFDGLPAFAEGEQFDNMAKESGFIAQRTYSAPSQEVLDAYRDELYNGKWYVDCSTGGAQYGQGMYSAADYTGTLSEGITEEMNHYKELGRQNMGFAEYQKQAADLKLSDFDFTNKVTEQEFEAVKRYTTADKALYMPSVHWLQKEDKEIFQNMKQKAKDEVLRALNKMQTEVMNNYTLHSYTETFTLDKSAKILTIYNDSDDIGNFLANEYARKHCKKSLLSTLKKLHEIEVEKSKMFGKTTPFSQDRMDEIYEESEKIKSSDAYAEITKLYSEFFSFVNTGDNGKPLNDGAVAALMGYDAINAVGHGKSGSYTVILNRTKVIFKR